MPTSQRELDQRSQQTRAAIIGAFNELFIAQRYDDISVSAIIARAGVGRSTFYEHFRNKDETLKVSVMHVLTGFADAAGAFADKAQAAANVQRLQQLLDHFHENQRRARGLLEGPSVSAVMHVLAEMIAERLAPAPATAPAAKDRIPRSLATMTIAQAQLGLVVAWLNDLGSCTSATLAQAIHNSTRSLVTSLCGD